MTLDEMMNEMEVQQARHKTLADLLSLIPTNLEDSRLKFNQPASRHDWYDLETMLSNLSDGFEQLYCSLAYSRNDSGETFLGELRSQFAEIGVHTWLTWLCTDPMVGTYAHYYNGELFAVTTQAGRRCDQEWYIINGPIRSEILTEVFNAYMEFASPAVIESKELQGAMTIDVDYFPEEKE